MIVPFVRHRGTLAERLIPSLLAISITLLAIAGSCDRHGYLPVSALIFLLLLGAARELTLICQKSGYRCSVRWSLTSALLPFLINGWGGGQPWASGLGVLLALVLPIAAALRSNNSRELSRWAVPCFVTLYLGVPVMLLHTLTMPKVALEASLIRWQLAFFLLTVKGSDVGGFLIGRYWGSKPLAPHISPGKTCEGALGGLLFSCLLGLLLYQWFPVELSRDPSSVGAWVFRGSSMRLLVSALLLGIASQAGDLFESYLKRLAKVKDSGNLAGFGGVLDLLDSILGATFVFWILLQAQWL